jgi:S-adenosylmethionine synthetase
MSELVISPLKAVADEVEVVERKGVGHPDTICDALAETLSRNLCREYQNRFGQILHHNVDKALLCGGQAEPAFRGGRVTVPIRIFLAGRATTRIGGEVVPVADIAVDGSQAWLRSNLHALDVERDVCIETVVQQGSQDLQGLFARGRGSTGIPLANDTSFGVGHAPLGPVERFVLAIEKQLHDRDRLNERPAWGEDIKIMAVRNRDRLMVTIACAMIGRFLADTGGYLEHRDALADCVRECARRHGFEDCEIAVNAADDVGSGSIYLTVTGTSAEAGDDGQVGRGNRVNGLITPLRPMSLEAAAGKNPVSHVGKIYNVLATRMAEAIVSLIPEVSAAQCLIVSKIGAAVSSPALVHVKLATQDGMPSDRLRGRIEEITGDHLTRVPELVRELVGGNVRVF